MKCISKLLLAGAALVLVPAVAPAQEVLKEISAARLEGILKGLNIEYTKGEFNKTPYYDYAGKTGTVRLWNFGGKDLMLDAVLPRVDWEAVNNWNGTAKFSRARLIKDNTVVESNIDLAGGITEEAIKHFIRNFDKELSGWVVQAAPLEGEDETFKSISAQRLEKILGELKIKFEKKQGKDNNVTSYDFQRGNYRIRVTNFAGNDLMIDCTYADASLATINQWNAARSFVRAVRYPGNGKAYTALESNLDCSAGVSEGMIRYFITTFDGEAAAFDNHLKGHK